MSHYKLLSSCLLFSAYCVVICACGGRHVKDGSQQNPQPAALALSVTEDIRSILEMAKQNKSRLNDTVRLYYPDLMDSVYTEGTNQPLWSRDAKWLPQGDSLYDFIEGAKNFGLFPDDYHFRFLSFIHRVFASDSLSAKNKVLWARADILLTDGFFRLVKDLHQGRLPFDSVTLRNDTLLESSFYLRILTEAHVSAFGLKATLQSIEPRHPGYDSLKNCIKDFVSKADFSPYTHLSFPYRDSVFFFNALQKRFLEIGFIPKGTILQDTTAFISVIRRYQKAQDLKVTGHMNNRTVSRLNNSDWEKFKRIAINLDRYKLLPDSLPESYAWVNLPSFILEVMDHDTVVFQSKVIVGGPDTRTPQLNGEISNFITLPQWTVPYSIIFKEMLPKMQRNVDFLKKENLMIVDKNDSVLDPSKINWKKMSRNHFPYQIKQRQGDDNSLGVIKFNFRNKYSVYLHDTNVRWLFGKSFRALSHGCVRVKDWGKLADFLIRTDTIRYQPDTVRAWIKRQEKHVVSGFPKLPIFIRYFTCEGKDHHIRFYEDIYDEDKYLLEKYFADKTVD